MLRALVLAACLAPAAQEWVEISQQHYRRPTSRPGLPPEQDDAFRLTFYPVDTPPTEQPSIKSIKQVKRPILYQEEIEQIDRFPNYSISEHNWNNDRLGNRRLEGKIKIRPNVTPEFSLEIYGQASEEDIASDHSILKDKDIFSATIERVPNKGTVKRVQLANTPVKSPSVTNAGNINRRHDFRQQATSADDDYSDEFEIKSDIFRNKLGQTLIAHEDKVFSSTKDTTIWKHDKISTSTSKPYMIFQKYPQSQQINTFTKTKNNVRDIGGIRNNSIAEDNVFSYDKNKESMVKTALVKDKESTKEDISFNFVVKNKINEQEHVDSSEITTDILLNSSIPNASDKHKSTPVQKDQKPKKNETGSKENINEEIKVSTMANLMKFVKVVADTISKNTKRGVNGKVKYLNELKETLLNSIKERIDSTWPDDAEVRVRRSARGHVEFPSSESSLMTISFLTFAVFLIKLVLQVIQTYKNKAMMVAPLVVATAGRNMRHLRVRNLN